MPNNRKEQLINDGKVLRLTSNQRIQHITLIVTMVILTITGLALKFHETFWGAWLIRLEGGVEARGIIHRIAAIILIVLSIYHALFVVFSKRGHEDLMKIKPSIKDIRDFFKVTKYNLGLNNELPKFGKFSYKEKIQYWGVILGTLIMILTGFILWFETQSMAIMPKWMLDVTTVVHGWEAILAFIVLLLWHLYNVHLNPDVFPMSKIWLNGKISIEDLKKNHPLEYEEMQDKADVTI